jgi:hypothetical protein
MEIVCNIKKVVDWAFQSQSFKNSNRGTKMADAIQEIIAKISALPEPMRQQVINFIDFMLEKAAKQTLTSTTSNQSETKIKRRSSPVELAGQVTEQGDVMSSWTNDK